MCTSNILSKTSSLLSARQICSVCDGGLFYWSHAADTTRHLSTVHAARVHFSWIIGALCSRRTCMRDSAGVCVCVHCWVWMFLKVYVQTVPGGHVGFLWDGRTITSLAVGTRACRYNSYLLGHRGSIQCVPLFKIAPWIQSHSKASFHRMERYRMERCKGPQKMTSERATP